MNFQTGKNRHLGKVPDATGGALQNSVGGVGGWGRVFLRGEAKNEYTHTIHVWYIYLHLP